MTHHILRSTPATAELKVYSNGDLTNLDTDPTVVFTDANGATVSSGAVTKPGATTGTYRSVLPGQANLKLLDAAWSGVLGGQALVLHQTYEIVGRLLFSEADARSFGAKDDAQAVDKPLADGGQYLDVTIAEERTRITDMLEAETGRSWIPRYARVETASIDGRAIDLESGACRTSTGNPLTRPGRGWDVTRLISVTVNGVSVSIADFVIDSYRLIYKTNTWPAASWDTPFPIVVQYEYGAAANVDGVDRIALKELVDRLVPSGYPDRALTWDAGMGSIRLVQPGGPMRNVSRIPDVNAWVASHDVRVSIA